MKASDVLARYKPAQKKVRVLLDGTLPAQADELRAQIKTAKRTEGKDGLKSQTVQLEEQLEGLQAAADEASAVFTLTAVPGSVLSPLVLAHPPTEEDWDTFKELREHDPLFARAPEYNMDTFAPALIGLSVTEVDDEPVEWDEADGQELWEQLHDGARAVLWDATLAVNFGRSERPLSKTATGTTTDSGSGSTTPPNEESPTPSS